MAGLASFGIDEPRTQNDAPTETQTAETEELPLFVSCHDIASKGASYIYIPGRGGKHESAGGFRGGKSMKKSALEWIFDAMNEGVGQLHHPFWGYP